MRCAQRVLPRGRRTTEYRPLLAQQVAAASGANQQGSPKPTVVALEAARRGVFPRVRTRARAADRGTAIGGIDPRSASPTMGRGEEDAERIGARSAGSLSPHVADLDSSRDRTIMAADVTASLVFLPHIARSAIAEPPRLSSANRRRGRASRSRGVAARKRNRIASHSRGRDCQIASRWRRRVADAIERYRAAPIPSRPITECSAIARCQLGELLSVK